jgi:N-acetyl sugar amidotransferase
VKWCKTCVLPDTRPNLVIGPDGICNACASHRTKRVIDWPARQTAFRSLVDAAKADAKGGYHCLIPVSGGKDSTWQVVTCLEHGLRPLCVTWRTPGRTPLGEANLRNLISLGVDHIDYSIDPSVERRFMLKAIERYGAPAVPMHMAIFNIPLNIAVALRIPLVVWGENSAFEYGGTDEESRGFALDEAWVRRFGVMQGTTAADWIDEDLTAEDLIPYRTPNEADLTTAGTRAVFLGYYFQWDPETSLRVAIEHGFRRASSARTGLYDYADIDDDFISVHHWFKWYKFGFTRLFDNLSIEIRNGRVTREQAIDTIRGRGDDTPFHDIDALSTFLGISRERFFEIAEKFRNPAVWSRRGNRWTIPGFLIPDWHWT